MDSKAFYEAVKRMREAQKEYFKTRRPTDLKRSKELEKVIDTEIARVERILWEQKNPPLFPNNKHTLQHIAMIIQRQTWHSMTRLLIAERKGSVQVEMYAKKQRWGGTAWIYGLWVEPEYRRQGKADELLTVAEDMAAQHNHKSVMLEWKQRDTPVEVLHWYLRRGYKEIRFSGKGDHYLLEKQLRK